jgi:hypothetical protein
MILQFFRHPVIGRASSTFISCGIADASSQLFLTTPATVDPDRTIRFSLSGALSIVPVWFGWNALLNRPVDSAAALVRRVGLEALLFGPAYLISVLWWNGLLDRGNWQEGLRAIREGAVGLYIDALKVVPAYNAVVYFVFAPHMRGYGLMGFQFLWNIYVSWFVQNSITKTRLA